MEKLNIKLLIISFVSGLLFAAGLTISGMIQPARVKAFLDVAGKWDASLALVMASAVGVYFFANELVAKKAQKPIFCENWSHLPTPQSHLPIRMLVGNILFGVGWGLVGYCPAPGLMSLASLHLKSFVFVGSMLVGFLVWDVGLRNLTFPNFEVPVPNVRKKRN